MKEGPFERILINGSRCLTHHEAVDCIELWPRDVVILNVEEFENASAKQRRDNKSTSSHQPGGLEAIVREEGTAEHCDHTTSVRVSVRRIKNMRAMREV